MVSLIGVFSSKEETPTRHEDWGTQKQEIPNQDVQDENGLLHLWLIRFFCYN